MRKHRSLTVAALKEERAASLDQACGGDAELRRRVEAVLHAHADAGSPMRGVGQGGSGKIAEKEEKKKKQPASLQRKVT